MFKAYQVFVSGLTENNKASPPAGTQANQRASTVIKQHLLFGSLNWKCSIPTNTESWAKMGKLGRRKKKQPKQSLRGVCAVLSAALCSPQAMFPCQCFHACAAGWGLAGRAAAGHGFPCGATGAAPRNRRCPHPTPSAARNPTRRGETRGGLRRSRPPACQPSQRTETGAGAASAWPGPLPLTLALPASSLRLRASSCASMRRPGAPCPAGAVTAAAAQLRSWPPRAAPRPPPRQPHRVGRSSAPIGQSA